MLAEDLLAAVRSELSGGDVVYAEPPVLLSGGFFTENYAFRLAGAPAPWDGPLVAAGGLPTGHLSRRSVGRQHSR
jgi:hypothetical protein